MIDVRPEMEMFSNLIIILSLFIIAYLIWDIASTLIKGKKKEQEHTRKTTTLHFNEPTYEEREKVLIWMFNQGHITYGEYLKIKARTLPE